MEEKIEYTPEIIVSEAEAAGPTRAQMRRTFSLMALGLCLGGLISQLIPSVLVLIIPGFDIQAHAFLVGSLCTWLFTLPVMLLLTRRFPARQPEKHALSVGGFLALVSISYAGMVLGNLAGILVNSLISPGSVELVNQLATATGASAELFITFVVLGPIAEELVFRKVLVDKVLPCGEWPAILFSGVCFGLFHGNLTQFFYTTLLGMILAYVYIRTGRILYTIGIHACINFMGGVLPLLFPAAAYGVMLVAVAGIALFIVLRRDIHVARNAVPGVGGAMFGNAGMILFLLLSGLLMALVAVAMNHPELTQMMQ